MPITIEYVDTCPVDYITEFGNHTDHAVVGVPVHRNENPERVYEYFFSEADIQIGPDVENLDWDEFETAASDYFLAEDRFDQIDEILRDLPEDAQDIAMWFKVTWA